MPKKIKHVSELPEWFKLEKYEFTKNLDALGWYEQFYVRNTFLTHAREMREEKIIFPVDFKQAMQASRENPNTIIDNDPRLVAYCDLDSAVPFHPLKRLKEDNNRGLKPIKSITMRDYIGFKYFMQAERIKYIEDWYNKPDTQKELFPDDAPWFNEPISNSFTPRFGKYLDTINVNLRLPDSFLIECFKNYLADRRKDIQAFPKKQVRESDFNNWVKLAVLPYLDLLIWTIEEEAQIPNRIYAEALYPYGEKGDETIRKTTSQLAEAVLDNKNIFQLIKQAATDISEKNSL